MSSHSATGCDPRAAGRAASANHAEWIVDAWVTPRLGGRDLREYMPRPWSRWLVPGEGQFVYPVDGDELVVPPDAAASPEAVACELGPRLRAAGGFERAAAVLVPPGRGLLPNVDQGTAVASATNRWLAEVWLAESHPDLTTFGSIRVEPRHPERAVAEIEQWAPDPRFVQVAVSLQAASPYGKREYWPIWEAASAAGLPVSITTDGGWGIEFPAGGAGHPQLPAEFVVLNPYNYAYHLASMVAEGLFGHLPALRVVTNEAGALLHKTIAWRMDKDWRSSRDEVPWVDAPPSTVLDRHVRHVTNAMDWPADPAALSRWFDLEDQGSRMMFGSGFPAWDCAVEAEPGFREWPDERRSALCGGTAFALYDLDARLASRAHR